MNTPQSKSTDPDMFNVLLWFFSMFFFNGIQTWKDKNIFIDDGMLEIRVKWHGAMSCDRERQGKIKTIEKNKYVTRKKNLWCHG